MTIYSRPICVYCARLHWPPDPAVKRDGLTCDAFPDGIPAAIKQSQVDHRTTYVEGDYGLLFFPKDPDSMEQAAQAWADAHYSAPMPPPAPPKKPLPVINLDDTPENANWLRIMAKQRRRKEREGKGQGSE